MQLLYKMHQCVREKSPVSLSLSLSLDWTGRISTYLPFSPDDETSLYDVLDYPCTRKQRWVFEHAFVPHYQHVRGAAFTNAAQQSFGADEARRHYRERG